MNSRTQQQLLYEKLIATPQLIDQLLINKTGKNQFKRDVYIDLKKHLDVFLKVRKGCEWIIMPGLRGVGKTTILLQLYDDPLLKNQHKFYLSLDFVQQIGANMIDVEKTIEKILGSKIEFCKKPVFIFLDEVHFSPDWGVAIKRLVDYSDQLYVVCTGSPSLKLQIGASVARRADIMRINPLSFTEFATMRQIQIQKDKPVYPLDEKIRLGIREALFEAGDIVEAGKRLQTVIPQIPSYWSKISQDAFYVDEYITYGTLPLATNLRQNEQGHFLDSAAWQQIVPTLDSILLRDIAVSKKFNNHVLMMFSQLFFQLTHAGTNSLAKRSKELNLNIKTIQNMLMILCQNEIIMIVRPWSFGRGRVRKTNKYLFTSPALRFALSRELRSGLMKNAHDYHQFQRSLLEDTVASYLKRLFTDEPLSSALEYDATEKGADLIASRTGLKENAIVIEVGINKFKAQQVVNTLQKGGRYGLVINKVTAEKHVAEDQQIAGYIKVDAKQKVLHIPLGIFLLL